MESSKLFDGLQDLLQNRKEIEYLEKEKKLLEKIPSKVTGEHRHRFATFTARSGRTVLEEFEEIAAKARSAGPGSRLLRPPSHGGLGASSKFAKKQDELLRQIIQTDEDVKEGMIRQYFVYIDSRMKPQIATKIDIPVEHFSYRVPRDLRAHPDMLRLTKFELSSMDLCLEQLQRDFKNNLENAQELFCQFVSEGSTSFPGPENFAASLSRKSSIGGILVEFDDGSSHQPGTMPFEMRFCPHCVNDWLNNLESSLSNRGFQGIPFPPIPILSLPLDEIDTLCTENKHTKKDKYSHMFSDCTPTEKIEELANTVRENLGIEKHTTVRIVVKLGTGSEKPPSRWAWIRIDPELQ